MKRRRIALLLSFAALLLLLAALLVAAEAGAAGATIVTLPAALWYLLTTLTTVGYGDLYPVTAAGRVIGAVFQLMSLGVLGALMGVLLAAIRAGLLPRLRLRSLRGRKIAVFSSVTPASVALARSLLAEEPETAALFPLAEGEEAPPVGIGLRLGAIELCSRLPEGRGALLFCAEEDAAANEALAARFAGRFETVCCGSDAPADHLPPNEVRFDAAQCCARLYWQRFPLLRGDERIVLIGGGKTAEALLEQALVGNVIAAPQHVSYTVCGDFADYRRLHPYLGAVFADSDRPDGDSLRFAAAPWSADFALLESADRIIICFENEAETRRALLEIRRCVPVTGSVHARLSAPFEGAETFGTDDELYTPALVIRRSLSETARYLHDVYRSENPAAPAWEALGDFLRRSNLAAADHVPMKIRILLGEEAAPTPQACADAYAAFAKTTGEARERLRRIEHDRWMRFHVVNNWRYNEARDNARRLHPLLVPYDRLSAGEQRKDDYAWETLELLGKRR